MKIAIVGPGALGCFLAARLRAAGAEVQLVDYRAERVARLRQVGVVVKDLGGGELKVQVPIATPEEAGEADLAILTVKAYQTRTAVAALERFLKPAGFALTLQNGLGNLEEMARVLGQERLLAGSTLLGVTRVGEGEVVLAGLGTTFLGLPPGSKVSLSVLQELAGLFHQAGLPAEVRKNIPALLWEKLLVNVAINPLTALLKIRNGDLPALPQAWELAVAAALEAKAVAGAEGIVLALDPEKRLREVCAATAANRSSMLQDVLARRPTEIAALNGQVVERGRKGDIPVPVNEVLLKLVQALEATYLAKNPRTQALGC